MNANKQDAGGLPELPSPIGWYRAWLPNGEPVDEFMPGANRPDDWPITDCAPMWSRRAMRAYGELCRAEALQRVSENAANMLAMPIEPGTLELCRAAPAGGDTRTVPFSDWMEAQHELGELRTMLARSAPAGSGEVDLEEFREAVDLLRITSLGGKRDCERHGTFPHDFDRSLAKADRLLALIDSRAALLRKLQQGAE